MRDIIDQKKAYGVGFTLDEIMYVMVSALQTYLFFKGTCKYNQTCLTIIYHCVHRLSS